MTTLEPLPFLILFGVGCNDEHGYPRSNADKEHAVKLLLADSEWGKRSSPWIAEKCRVTHNFVERLRIVEIQSGTEPDSIPPRLKNGWVRTARATRPNGQTAKRPKDLPA
jgi:hypothetical protein